MNEHNHGEFEEAVDTIKEFGQGGKFDLVRELKVAINIVKIRTEDIHAVAIKKSAALPALLMIIAGILAIQLGEYLNVVKMGILAPSISFFLTSFIIFFISTFALIFVYEFIGTKVFKGKGDFGQLFRVIGYGNLILVASIIPIFRGIAFMWYAIVVYESIKHVKGLNPLKSILTILISTVIVGVVAAIISLFFGSQIMDIYGLGLSYLR